MGPTGIDIKNTFFGTNSGAKTLAGTDLFTFVGILLPNILLAAGIIFFLLLLGGGFSMIRSAGSTPRPEDVIKAKNAVTFALVGFLLVIFAYFILEIVGAMVGIDFISPRAI